MWRNCKGDMLMLEGSLANTCPVTQRRDKMSRQDSIAEFCALVSVRCPPPPCILTHLLTSCGSQPHFRLLRRQQTSRMCNLWFIMCEAWAIFGACGGARGTFWPGVITSVFLLLRSCVAARSPQATTGTGRPRLSADFVWSLSWQDGRGLWFVCLGMKGRNDLTS